MSTRRNLSTKGLSLSQAQSISNLCYQRSKDIESELYGINNVSKSFKIGNETLIETNAKPIPDNVVELIMEKSKLHACQAFLMEHIKLKELLINNAKRESYNNNVEQPEEPKYQTHKVIPTVDDNWGWNQISDFEKNDYLESEAYAAHIGQFIHKNGVLDNLRAELPRIKTLEFIELERDKKTPLTVIIHHTPEQLLKIHNKLAEEHRKYEQKVNYYKSKVKNLVTSENARIAKENGNQQSVVNTENAKLRDEYNSKLKTYYDEVRDLQYKFEENRQNDIKEISALRIEVDSRFQDVIDKYLKLVITDPEI
jgi:hypothetical protein